MPEYYNVLPELDLWVEVKAGNGHIAGAAATVGTAQPVALLPVPGSLGVNAANMGFGALLLGSTLTVSVVLLRPGGPPIQGIHTVTLHQRIPLLPDGTVAAGTDPAFRFNEEVFGPNHANFGADAQAHGVVLIELQ